MSAPTPDFGARLDRLQSSVDELRNRLELLAAQSKCRDVPAASHARPKVSTLLTRSEMAALFGCDVRSLRRWEVSGAIPRSIRVGGVKRWRGGEVAKWLEARRR